MDEHTFWKIIDETRDEKDPWNHHERIKNVLLTLKREDIIDFGVYFMNAYDMANTWDIRAVVFIINNGCSEDGFIDFRGWLISQGKEFFLACIKDPNNIASRDKDSMFYEEMPSSYVYAYEEITGEDFPDVSNRLKFASDEPQGNRWTANQLFIRFPELCKRYNFKC